jgi:hypothetical protein
MTPDKSQVPQADPPAIGLHNSNKRRDRKKVTYHMRDKYVKRDIKLKHNSMNINAYSPRRRMAIDAASRLIEEFEWSLPRSRTPLGS